MRTIAKLFFGLAVFVFIACSDKVDVTITELGQDIGGVLNEVTGETFFSSLFVTTYNPDVQDESVEFKGEILENKEAILVTYGFMWYDSSNPDLQITTIELGSTTEEITFSADVTNLPKKESLVVCTFLRHEGDGDEEHQLIGDEVAFSNL